MADVTNDQPAAAWWWHPTVVGPLLACLVLAVVGGYIWWNGNRAANAQSEADQRDLLCLMLEAEGDPLPRECYAP